MHDRINSEERTSHPAAEPGDRPGGIKAKTLSASGEVTAGLREFAERSPLGLAIISGEELTVRYVNPAFRRLTGAEPEAVLGRPFADAFPWPGGERMLSLVQEVWQTGEPRCNLEVRPPGKAPEGACWKLTVWPMPAGDDRPRVLALEARDAIEEAQQQRRADTLIEEMREINQRLVVASLREQELAEQAKAANEAKSIFLATMSHELRTPLTAVLGYEELLEDAITGPVTPEQRTQLRRIRASAKHLLELIDGILTLSRLEAQREVLHREPVSSSSLLDQAATLVLPLATAKHLAFTVEPPAQAFVVDTDTSKVRQILVNLLANAIKFTDHGEVILSACAEHEDAVFTVRDTGVGIAPEHLEHIFDPFWQVQQTKTRRVDGTGLGLHVSRRLARLLGGDITVESAAGTGSTFRLRLPA